MWLVLEDVSELRRLQQIRTEFIDNLSHELRTPLTTVSLLAETLTREAEVAGDAIPPKMRERIANIEIETGHLVQMVSELLDLSRIESGGALGALELLDLGAIATESTERLRLFADRQGVVLETAVDGPPSAGPGRREPARPGPRQPPPQRGQVQPGRRHRPGERRIGRPRGRRRRRRPRRSGSRGPPRHGSSSASTRSTEPGSAARPVGRGSDWRSPDTSSNSTAAGSGSNPPKASAARSRFALPVAGATSLTADAAPERSGWPIAGTGGRRPRTRSPRSPRHSRSRPATGSSSTFASRPTGCR